MARTVGEELYWVRREVDRYFIELHREFQRLGYPREAAFAKHASRGTVSLPPTAEADPMMDCVGRWYFTRSDIERYVLSSSVRACDGRTAYLRARAVGINEKRYSRILEKLLRELKGYLSAFKEIGKAA